MRRLNLLVILFACPILTFGQLKVNSTGDTYATKNIYIGTSSNFLGTTTSLIPVIFKVNGTLAVGQRAKQIVPQQNQKTGTYSVQTSVANLGTGTYIVKVTSGNQIESKQLIINY